MVDVIEINFSVTWLEVNVGVSSAVLSGITEVDIVPWGDIFFVGDCLPHIWVSVIVEVAVWVSSESKDALCLGSTDIKTKGTVTKLLNVSVVLGVVDSQPEPWVPDGLNFRSGVFEPTTDWVFFGEDWLAIADCLWWVEWDILTEFLALSCVDWLVGSLITKWRAVVTGEHKVEEIFLVIDDMFSSDKSLNSTELTIKSWKTILN